MTGYALEGPKWTSGPITWSFASASYGQDSSDPFSSAISASYQAAVTQALQQWASVSGVTFEQVPDTSDPSQAADIRIGFGNFGSPGGPGAEIGETDYAYTGSGAFVPDVVVRFQDPRVDPLIQGAGGIFTYQGTASTLNQVALHEIGHAIGLAHSTDSGAVMYPVAQPSSQTLDSNDIAGVQALYGAPALAFPTAIPPTVAPINLATVAPDPMAFASNPDMQVSLLYQAAFNRLPDASGLAYWTGDLASGVSLTDEADGFAASPEFIARYGAPDNASFVADMYQNSLGRAPDPSGFAYWVSGMDSGTVSRAALITDFAESQENLAVHGPGIIAAGYVHA